MGRLETYRRHDLIWISRQGWRAVCATHQDELAGSMLRHWSADNLPVVCRRRDLADDCASLPVGLAILCEGQKRRYGFSVHPKEVAKVRPPLTLRDAATRLPSRWATILNLIDQSCSPIGFNGAIFGSASWQAVSGMPYLTDHSDIDLLWYLNKQNSNELPHLLTILEKIERENGTRLDGELISPSGGAVNWRELLPQNEASDLLIKYRGQSGLIARETFFKSLLEHDRASSDRG